MPLSCVLVPLDLFWLLTCLHIIYYITYVGLYLWLLKNTEWNAGLRNVTQYLNPSYVKYATSTSSKRCLDTFIFSCNFLIYNLLAVVDWWMSSMSMYEPAWPHNKGEKSVTAQPGDEKIHLTKLESSQVILLPEIQRLQLNRYNWNCSVLRLMFWLAEKTNNSQNFILSFCRLWRLHGCKFQMPNIQLYFSNLW